MATEKEEISLIMQSDNLTPSKLRLGWEKGPKQSPNTISKKGSEIVQYELR